ncbi:MAG TPA: TIR domain-containing protein [Thermoanaerobaculia bacterium]|nr:TIR domain-containing protein [Thermoanaerobaculia bacterium]
MSSQRDRPRERSSNIFINYRREDSSGHAGRLFDALNAHFAGRVFMDIDTLEPGVDFAEVIEQAVGSCEVLIVIIGREWLHIKNAAGRRRLDDPADFVRLELESALKRSIRVIPVLVQGAAMPSTEELPDSLARLARRNAIEISDARWAYDVDRLLRTIQEILAEEGLAPEGTPAGAMAGAVQAAGSRVWLFSLAAAVLVAVLVLSAVLWMRRTPSGNGEPAPDPKVRLAAGGATAPTGGVATGNPVASEPVPRPAPVSDPPRKDAASAPSAVEPSRETASAKPPGDGEPPQEPAKVRPAPKPGHKTPPVQIPFDDGRPSEPSKSTATAAPRPEKTAAAVPALPPRFTITQPAAGADVGSTVQVQGTVADLGEHRAFLCIRQGDGKIYPRGEVFPEANGKWSIQLRSSKEKTFDVLILTTSNKPAAQALSDQKYRDDGLDALPDGAFISSGIVAVKRMGKLREVFGPGS